MISLQHQRAIQPLGVIFRLYVNMSSVLTSCWEYSRLVGSLKSVKDLYMRALNRIPSPRAKAPMTQQTVQPLDWSPPSLRVNNIAAITEGGLSSLMDNCGNPADGGMCP